MIKNSEISDLNLAEESIRECKNIAQGNLSSPGFKSKFGLGQNQQDEDLSSPVINVRVDVKSSFSTSPKRDLLKNKV